MRRTPQKKTPKRKPKKKTHKKKTHKKRPHKKKLKKGWITSPISRRPIKVNGPTYNRLIREEKIAPGGPIHRLPAEMNVKIMMSIPPDQLVSQICKTSKYYQSICESYSFYRAYCKKWFDFTDLPDKDWVQRDWPNTNRKHGNNNSGCYARFVYKISEITYIYYKNKKRHKVVFEKYEDSCKGKGEYIEIKQHSFQGKKEDGIQREWYYNGQIQSESRFKNGTKVGIWTDWGDNGEMELRSWYYTNGKRLTKEYGWNEELIGEYNFKDGKEHGSFKEYGGGKLHTSGTYKRGEKHGVWKGYENGVVWDFQTWKYGKKHGVGKTLVGYWLPARHERWENGNLVKDYLKD